MRIMLLFFKYFTFIFIISGTLAHLGERTTEDRKVRGSSPRSPKLFLSLLINSTQNQTFSINFNFYIENHNIPSIQPQNSCRIKILSLNSPYH